MNRKTYLITSTLGHSVTRSAFNSARLGVVSLVRDMADQTGDTWRLVETVSTLDKRGRTASLGQSQVWRNQNTGQAVRFTIALQPKVKV